jgi:hypothetical protein
MPTTVTEVCANNKECIAQYRKTALVRECMHASFVICTQVRKGVKPIYPLNHAAKNQSALQKGSLLGTEGHCDLLILSRDRVSRVRIRYSLGSFYYQKLKIEQK